MKANVSSYECKFSVLAVPKHSEMFMMNMQVYDVIPCPVAVVEDAPPVSVVWCAVFNIKGMRKA